MFRAVIPRAEEIAHSKSAELEKLIHVSDHTPRIRNFKVPNRHLGTASASFRPGRWNLVALRSALLPEQYERKPLPNQGPPAPRLDARRFEESKSIAVQVARPAHSPKDWIATGPRRRPPVRLALASLQLLRTTSSVDDYSDGVLLLWSRLRAGRKPSWSESPTATRHCKSLTESVPKSSAPFRFAPAPRERARQSDKSWRGFPPIRQSRPAFPTMISLLPSCPAFENLVNPVQQR